MHPALPKLLAVQEKDERLSGLAATLADLTAEGEALDAAEAGLSGQIASAERGLAEATRRRDERAAKLEAQRLHQEKRRERLDQERSPRVAAQLMADLEMARGILAQEESDWIRAEDEVNRHQNSLESYQQQLEALRAEQEPLRSDLAGRTETATAEHDEAVAEREAAAGELDRTLRNRYDRLRKSRNKAVLVAARNGTCTACYTAIPSSRLGHLQADGLLLDGCEMCGAILYVDEVAS